MKRRKAVTALTLTKIGMICAAALLLLNASISTEAFAINPPDAIKRIPSDYQFVSGINMRKLAASPFYVKFRQEQKESEQLWRDLSKFKEQTGVDPDRDVSYLVMAMRSGPSTKSDNLMVVSGMFDKNRINRYVRSKASPTQRKYRGATLLMVPDPKDSNVKNGMVFLSEQEIALGNLESLKAVLDIKTGRKKNILSNAVMASLISSIDFNEMIWFAGETASVLRNSPVPMPPNLQALSIQSIVGTFAITDNIIGKITATALDADKATKLADAFRGIIALAQFSKNQNADSKLLFNGLAVSQNATNVSLNFTIPGDLIIKLGRAKRIPDGR